MPDIANTAYGMIAGMKPELIPGVFVFVSTTSPTLIASLSSHAIATFREEEGLSLLVPIHLAERSGIEVSQPMRCITLNVYSSLEGVGLTAAVSKALSDADIPCNMIAAFHHDHVFVPSDRCANALEVLAQLQSRASEYL